MLQVFNVELMDIFFDESGRNKDKPTTMGGLLFPTRIYNTYEFNRLSEKLRNKEMKLHWTDYAGYSKLRDDITETIHIFSRYAKFTKMNVINYNPHTLNERNTMFNGKDFSDLMIYTKLPERIFYGLLRNYGSDVWIKANIYIEEATKYTKLNLPQRMIEQLNTQSLYRGEQYSVLNCELEPKGKRIGLELVDLLLGIIRTIITNVQIPFGISDVELKRQSLQSKHRKNELVVALLHNQDFYTFLSNIKYYEWNGKKELTEINFAEYLTLFVASHHREFENAKPEENFTRRVPTRRYRKFISKSMSTGRRTVRGRNRKME
ncbi:DUF3800 domain-containing protein [Bacillus salitolerans]|uniref:DUF3800 domain-containing protein n=1 Tax=Bacillus salitolerans TaxID=1437434 RepID=A0ABW4LPV3_9BACI